MMISKELAAAIMEQVGHEFEASHQYVNIAAYFDSLALKGLAKMFYKQGEEEREHSHEVCQVRFRSGRRSGSSRGACSLAVFKSVKEALELSLKWELEVTRRINALMVVGD